jgi:hypothetical protein
MKLNFWQWIGILIVLVALIVIVRREMGGGPNRSPNPAPEFSPQKAVEVPTPSTQTAAPTTGPAAP